MAFQRVQAEKPIKDMTPLDVKCTTTRCGDNFHCFKTSRKMLEKYGKIGVCRDCGEDMVDWKRIQKNQIGDSKYTFKMLRVELLRHICWKMPLKQEIIDFALKRGQIRLKERARKILSQKIGKASNFREGFQTPKAGKEIIHYAQHATATCCRKCMEYWHNIPMGTELTKGQIDYATDLVMLFVEERIKNLTKDGAHKLQKSKNNELH